MRQNWFERLIPQSNGELALGTVLSVNISCHLRCLRGTSHRRPAYFALSFGYINRVVFGEPLLFKVSNMLQLDRLGLGRNIAPPPTEG